jgi:hypothetical protein
VRDEVEAKRAAFEARLQDQTEDEDPLREWIR